jgi:membrane protease YdiL (CAAX protease family)
MAKVVGSVGLATLCAAFAEEVVFRRWIPQRLGLDDAPPSAALVILPQISFSLAHAANPSFIAARPVEFIALFVAGLLYSGLTRVGGLGMAAAVHGAINLALT